MKTRILLLVTFFCTMFFAFDAKAQIDNVDYRLKFNPDSCWYEAYIIINSGSANAVLDRTQFNAQMTVVVPANDTLTMKRMYAPFYNNQSGSNNTSPIDWSVTTVVYHPAAMPSKDFYSIVPTLSPSSFFNDLNSGDTIKLFSFSVKSYAQCGSGIRFFENGSDPGPSAAGMNSGDFSNGYTIGSINQLYNANSATVYPPKPVLIDPPLVSCAAGISIDLDASTPNNACQGPLTYAWTGPNYTGTSQDVAIIPSLATDAGLYKVVVTDAFGCKDSLELTVDNKPDAGPDFVNCAGTSRNIVGTNPSTGTWAAISGNPAGATMGSSVAGTATITFSDAASGTYGFRYSTVGCSDDMEIVVNPKPVVSITGAASICINSTTTLSPTTGGTWVSNNLSVATVNAATGVVTGVSQGLATFTFTNTVSGCTNTTGNVTVNSGPIADALRDTICIGSTTTISPPHTNGTWTVFNAAIASLSGSTVTGVSTGSAKFLFTEAVTGCKTDTLRIVVRPRPTVTASPGILCPLGTVQLSPSSGGTWSTTNPLAAISNSGLVTASGTITSVATATFTFTDASTGCISDPTGTLTINPRPTVSLNGSNNICVGLSRTLSPNTGGTWVSNSPLVASVVAATGVVTVLKQGPVTFTFTNTVTGCNNTTPTLIVNPPPTVSIGKDTICVGNTTVLSPSSGGSWAALNSTIASLSSGTTVTGVAAGLARFRFTETPSGCQAFDTVIVQARPIVTNGAAQICVGSTTQLAPGSGGSWQSSNGSIAIISNSALVTGIQAGTAFFTFTSSAGCISLPSANVQVNNAPVVSLNGAPTICLGDTRQLQPSTGGTWASSNPAVATVTAGGLVTATGAGAVNFTFTQAVSLCTATTGNLSINLPPVINNTGSPTICVGLTTQLNASTSGAWNALDPLIATITNTGLVTGVAAGTARFTFTDNNGCTSATLSVTIQTKVPVSVTGPLVICIGGTTTLSPTTGGSWAVVGSAATVTPAGVVTGVSAGTAIFQFMSSAGCQSDDITSISVEPTPVVSNGPGKVCIGSTIQLLPATGGTWISNNTSLATVVAGTGVVTGVAAGSVTFTFTTTAGCPSAPTSPVTVNSNPTAILALANLCVGKTTTVTPSNGGTWALSPLGSNVATVNNLGVVSATNPGSVQFVFTNTLTGCSSSPSSPLTVTAGSVVNVPDDQLCIGETVQLTTTPAAVGGTWTSSAPAVATVSSTGLVTAVSQGQIRVTYVDPSGCSSVASAPIFVNPVPVVAISGSNSICITGTSQLSPSTGGTWVSNSPGIASVTNTGLVTGLAAGTATFTFTDNTTGCSSAPTLPLTVVTAPTVSITGPTNLCVNGNTQLSPATGGTWVSNNPAVALVHASSGLVTAVGPGTATFTFTQSNSGCPAAATDPITVTQCLNPDFNATFVNVPVPGDVSTNDFTTGSSSYGPTPLLTSSPAGSVQTLVVSPDGTYVFTGSLVGVYKYLVPVCEAPQTSGCPTSDLWITVVDYVEPIKRPIANVDIATTAYQTAVTLRTMENDDCEYVTGCSLNPASVAIITNPKHGTVTAVNAGTGDITYTPATGFVGLDTLVYTICVTGEPTNCAQAKQIITVNGLTAPNSTAAADDFAVTMREVPVSGDVKLNDTDAEGHTQTVTAQTTTKTAGVLSLATSGAYTFTPAVGFFGPVDFPYTTCDSGTPSVCADATLHILVVPDLAIKIRVYLEGSLMNNANAVASTDGRPLMRDNLRVSPFTGSNYIPTTDPYKVATTYINVTSKFTHVAPGNRSDFASIPSPSTVFAVTGDNAIVDWVFVQLRSKSSKTTVLATRTGLLQRDGDVVDLNGIEALRFPGIPMDDYYVVVRHLRHLGVMTAAAQTPSQLINLVNFTKSTDLATFDFGAVGGPNAHANGQNYTGLSQNKKIKTGYSAMWGGDFDTNKKIKAENPNDDLNVLFADVYTYPNNGSGNANYDFAHGYLPGDYDMNSKAKFDNPNDDKNMLFAQLVTYQLNSQLLSNFDFFIEQLP